MSQRENKCPRNASEGRSEHSSGIYYDSLLQGSLHYEADEDGSGI